MRREKKQYDHEQKMMGGYVRAYPCNDWVKAKLYKTLAESAATVSLSGRPENTVYIHMHYLN